MDPSLDDFITYDNQFMLKHNSVFDAEFSLSSPFSENSDTAGVFPPFLPKTIQNLLDPDVESQNRESIFSSLIQKRTQIQNSKEGSENEMGLLESSESLEFIPQEEPKGKKRKSKINPESKRINKREKAKERKKAKKTSTEVLLQKADPKHIPKEMENPNLDSDTRKKMVQMIRNRISAQNSRDRKKFYIQQLEEIRDLLTEENSMLTSDKKTLLDKMQKMELDHEILIQEISTLKKNLPPVCSSCGFTMDYSSRNQETTEDNSSRDRSSNSSPFIERAPSRTGRGFFGFSMAFTALLCLFFVLSTDQSRGGNKQTTLVAIPRTLMNQFEMGVCKKSEEEIVQMVDGMSQTVDIPFETIQTKFAEIESNKDHLLNKIKPLMDTFEHLHKDFYQKYESNKLIVDISKTKISDIKLLDASVPKEKNSRRNFLEKREPIATPNKTINKTSTLFCPNGFEFFKANSTTGHEAGFNNVHPFANEGRDNFEIGAKTLDLEKAEYIQLLLPKQSIGRLGITENSSEINNLPTFQEAEEQNSVIEVWCKVFAVRDFAASL